LDGGALSVRDGEGERIAHDLGDALAVLA
jgi:hypothetical protein